MRAAAIVVAFAAAACATKSTEETGTPAGDYSFCEALNPSCTGVYASSATSCSSAAARDCSTLQRSRSQAYQAAVVSCAREFSPCTLAFAECVPREVARAPRTAPYEAVRSQFCSACPDGTAGAEVSCSTFFERLEESDTPRGTGMHGLGSVILDVDERFIPEFEKCAQRLDAGSAARGCDWASYASCIQDVAKAATMPSECR